MSARDAVIVDAVRTPVGKRNGFDPAVVDDVIWGCVQQVGQQGLNVARMAVLAAAVAPVSAFDCEFSVTAWFGSDVLWLAPRPDERSVP